MLVDWMWSRHAERERRRVDAARDLPAGRSRAGRALIEFNRRDHEWSRAADGVSALFVGPLFIVLGTLLAAGVLSRSAVRIAAIVSTASSCFTTTGATP
jgi:hypothetical protein